tara:strand:- start:343 stop:636 length:294 start_codon:yes stop_codon:yes gene_type:complete
LLLQGYISPPTVIGRGRFTKSYRKGIKGFSFEKPLIICEGTLDIHLMGYVLTHQCLKKNQVEPDTSKNFNLFDVWISIVFWIGLSHIKDWYTNYQKQ